MTKNTAPKYNPDNADHRRELAANIDCLCRANGMQERPNVPAHQETQMARRVRDSGGTVTNLQIVVYTSVVRGEVRDCGEDAIRVALLYRCKDGRVIGVGSTKRVHRTGEISAICERIHSRIKELEGSLGEIKRCQHCAAPMVLSSKKNLYCAEKCWLDKPAAKK